MSIRALDKHIYQQSVYIKDGELLLRKNLTFHSQKVVLSHLQINFRINRTANLTENGRYINEAV